MGGATARLLGRWIATRRTGDEEAAVERMNGLDAAFIAVEDAVNHMHIGAISIFEAPRPELGEIRAAIAAKLHLVPRCRQRVRELPAALGRPVWIDDVHFDLDHHVRLTALPTPDDDALDTLVSRMMSQRLDRRRPLWEMRVVDGLAEGRWAIVSKVHHCMVDGIAGSDLMAAILEVDHDATTVVPPPEWHPQPEPSRVALATEAAAITADGVAESARAVGRALLRPGDAAQRVGAIVSGISRLGNPIHTSPLTGPIGPERRWIHTQCTLDDIRSIRKAHGGTVNDVVLTVVSCGLRDLLIARGVDVTDRTVNTIIPVSVRMPDEHGLLDNRVAALFARLPVGHGTVTELLQAVTAHTEEIKQSHELEAARAVVTAASLAPPTLAALVTRALVHGQGLIETIVTNVPGPQFPLYLCGRRLEETYPYLPVAGNICLDVAVWSYDGRIFFGITGDWGRVPDIRAVTHGIERGLSELVGATE